MRKLRPNGIHATTSKKCARMVSAKYYAGNVQRGALDIGARPWWAAHRAIVPGALKVKFSPFRRIAGFSCRLVAMTGICCC